MQTYTIQVSGISGDVMQLLLERAQSRGKELTEYVLFVLEQEVHHEEKMTFRDVFVTSGAGFEKSGMSDDELSDFLEAEVRSYRQEQSSQERN